MPSIAPIKTTSPAPPLSQPQPTHLILLCCHAIYLHSTPTTTSSWLLAPFQTQEPPTFTLHLKTALTLLSSTPSSLLVISGSSTNPTTPISEARSYLDLAEENNFFNLPNENDELGKVIVLEEQALDSFANLLFGMMCFWKRTGRWPEKITVVSHKFKKERFEDVHARVLGVRGIMEFVGIDPGYMVEGSVEFDEALAEEVRKGERARGLEVWKKDERGEGMVLRGKRWRRNFWGREQLFFGSGEERERSGVRSRVVELGWVDGEGVERRGVEEVLVDGWQPWMGEEGKVGTGAG